VIVTKNVQWSDRSQGYKLRKHIAKALQVRSRTIRAALGRYNTVAKALKRRTLTWMEVIEYAFLSDFNILRDPTGNAALRPWAEPAQGSSWTPTFELNVQRRRSPVSTLKFDDL
jgi:hypothetical protein